MRRSDLLLVEDDPQIVRALVPALEVCGHRVKVANSGADALAFFAASSWDAMVVDLGLPDIDGLEVVNHVRLSSSIPVIVISARDSQEDQRACTAAGATAFLNKPFATPELIRRLAEHCSSHEAADDGLPLIQTAPVRD